MTTSEFATIEHYFNRPLRNATYITLGIGDDAAIMKPPPDAEILTSVDTQIINVHFLPTTAPRSIGYRALAISLSDIAAMGGHAYAALLSLTLPNIEPAWLDGFTQGFFDLATQHQIDLIGGNLSQGPTLTINITVFGWVPTHQALLRSGAQVGDDIYVSGSLGDAATALHCLKHQQPIDPYLQQRLEYPTPRLALGLALRPLATACIDISDGLCQDLGHLLTASRVGGHIQLDQLPLHPITTQKLPLDQVQHLALTGGDDYELCFTASPQQRHAIEAISRTQHCSCQRIGNIQHSPGLTVYNSQGKPVPLPRTGYQHFNP